MLLRRSWAPRGADRDIPILSFEDSLFCMRRNFVLAQSSWIRWLKERSSAPRLFVIVLIVLSGCTHRVVTVPVQIDSVPQGCPVDVDGINRGNTPTTVSFTVSQAYSGLLTGDYWYSTNTVPNVVTVYPPPGNGAGLMSQTKSIMPGNLTDGAGKVFFDLRLDSVQPKQRIDLTVKKR
jgi:hypothetical protein